MEVCRESRFRLTCMVADHDFPLVFFATVKRRLLAKKRDHRAVGFQHTAQNRPCRADYQRKFSNPSL